MKKKGKWRGRFKKYGKPVAIVGATGALLATTNIKDNIDVIPETLDSTAQTSYRKWDRF